MNFWRVISLGAIALVLPPFAAASASERFSIFDAIKQAVQTHPGVDEASANRRATESEMRQVQGTLLPQVSIDASIGRDRLDHHIAAPGALSGRWVTGKEASVNVRQLLYDGFTSINEVWRNAARTNSAAFRVLERTELVALRAAEAYIDVARYQHLIEQARRFLETHRGILNNVQARFDGGRAGEGDLQQARERFAAAEAIYAEFRQRLDEARGAYRQSVGLEPFNISFPSRLKGMPKNKDEALATTLQHNPTIQAADADAKAARHGFDATAGQFGPTVALEGRALTGRDTGGLVGAREEYSGRVRMTWNVFTGGQTSWRRVEMAERMAESSARHGRLQREAFDAIDRAWAARTITSDRAAALSRQIESARKTVEAYRKEYELGQRTLIDLLNAENQVFNAMVSLASTRGVSVFADYQLLAAMGKLLEYLQTAAPDEAEPLSMMPIGVYPTKLPRPIFRAPSPSGPEPLYIFEPMTKSPTPFGMFLAPKIYAMPTTKDQVSTIADLWPKTPALTPQDAAKVAQNTPAQDTSKALSLMPEAAHYAMTAFAGN
jgi:outer membrane protein, adhesin transport system